MDTGGTPWALQSLRRRNGTSPLGRRVNPQWDWPRRGVGLLFRRTECNCCSWAKTIGLEHRHKDPIPCRGYVNPPPCMRQSQANHNHLKEKQLPLKIFWFIVMPTSKYAMQSELIRTSNLWFMFYFDAIFLARSLLKLRHSSAFISCPDLFQHVQGNKKLRELEKWRFYLRSWDTLKKAS